MKIPQLIKNGSIYTLLMIFQKGIGFVLLPLYTAYLTPEDYGIQAVVVSVSSFLSMFLALGLDTAAQRFYFKHGEDKDYANKIYGTASIVILLNSFILGGIIIISHKYIIDPIINEVPFYPYVLLGLLYVLVNPLYILYQSYLQTIQNGMAYGVNSLLYTTLYIVTVVILLVYCDLGVLAILYSQLGVAIIFFIYVLIRFVSKLTIGIDKVFFYEALKYSLPILPHTLANWSNSTLDKLLVNKIRSAADTGIYGLAQQVSSVVNIASMAMNQAYLPWFFQKAECGDSESIRKVANICVIVLTLIATVLSLFSKEILDIMIYNPSFNDVYKLIPFLVFAYVFQLLYFFFVNVLFIQDTKIIFIITLFTVVTNVGLNLILIPLLGIIGAAITCTVTYLFKSIIALIISNIRNKTIRFNWLKMYLYVLFSFLFTIVILHLDMSDSFIYYMGKIVCVLLISLTSILGFEKDLQSIISRLI